MQHNYETARPPRVTPASYPEEWIRRRYRVSAAGAAVIAAMVFPNGIAFVEGLPSRPDLKSTEARI